MLEAIRKRSAGIVVKSLLGLLILSFAMWGIADVFNPSGTDQTLATIGEIEVQPEQVRREYQREIERLSTAFGTRLDAEQARMFGIGQAVVQRLVERSLYDLGARDLGILVNDDLVRRDISNFSGFKNANGEFERARFSQVLQSNRLSEDAYVEMTRNDIARNQYLSIVNSKTLAPKQLARSLYAYRNEQRIAETVSFKYDAVTDVGEPDTAALAKFHTDNAQSYTAPEYRSLTFINLTAEEIAKEIAVSDDTIATVYEERIGDYSEPEKRDLLQIRFKDEATAKAGYDRLKTGDDFMKIAKELADMEPEATQLGSMKKSELLPGLAEAAFGLLPDGYTEPVKSVLGWHILRLKSIQAARSKTLEEVSPELKKMIAAEQAIESLYTLANRLEDQLGGGSSLEEAARALNLPLKKQADVSKTGMTPSETQVTGLPAGNFLEVAFSTANGQESSLTEAGHDGYFIVRVDSVTETALRPLESVRAKVVTAWQAQKRREIARKSGEALIAEINAGGDLAKLAADKGLTVTLREPIGRNGGQGLPRDLIRDLFTTQIGKAAAAAGGDGYIVARLKEIKSADPIADADKVKTLSEELSISIRGDLMSQLAQGLRQWYPVSVNAEAINAQF
ncbi:MAG: SurA N-terminal domain-containing protein [Rhodospirillaceae bacterium]|nr:SurA N-terminal domain-containing protein [Rhodospirillaceae bacterium]MBL6930433.1 SurA N-terminal domain-containing protein [Rhodospirillales bacterium]MBL6942647.1 SurA N-terminal domain-containing protein [Rhodospirillales bacterium]